MACKTLQIKNATLPFGGAIFYPINKSIQEGLDKIGVKRARISKLKKRHSITIPTIWRVFKALGATTEQLGKFLCG